MKHVFAVLVCTAGLAATATAQLAADGSQAQPTADTPTSTGSLTYDDDVTPDTIFGAGNGNGAFTICRSGSIEIGLRGKLRFPSTGTYNSNGDGTYTFSTGSGTGGSFPDPEWNFEWAVNTDYDDMSGQKIDDLTYELGMDYDPGAGTDYLVFDPIIPGAVLPYTTTPPPTVYWDHSIGDNTTPNSGGAEAVDGPTYDALIAANNVAQQSWRMTFFDEPPFSFDPDVPGQYEIYLAAFDGGTEVARSHITVYAVDGLTLSLEADPCQTDQDAGTAGLQVAFDLSLHNPDDVDVSGWQAFLAFDDLAMTYEPSLSSYGPGPFTSHLTPIGSAEVAPGELRLDGNAFMSTPTMGDELLATLVFTVSECDPVAVDFDLTQPFDSEVSFFGAPLPTDLIDSPTVIADDTAPTLTCPADITQPADAGSCTEGTVTFATPVATDNCDPSPTVTCVPPSGSVFPVGTTTVTCTATDDCGNSDSCTFDVTVTATNAVDVVVELTGSMPATRCIRFVPDSCSSFVDIPLVFSGSVPATATTTIEVPCGVWTTLCAKDEQHTLWANTTLSTSGTHYVADTTLVLDGGDTDDDGDVDINDVTLLLGQFGLPASPGGCPWDGVTKDSDFSNNGVVFSEDYAFLGANWLAVTSCGCTLPLVAGNRDRLQQSVEVHDALTAAADLDGNRRVDVHDVELFEARYGLSGELSARMRATEDR